MVAITRGTNSTLKSETLESRLLEALYILSTKETVSSPFDIDVNIDFTAKKASVSFSIPAIFQVLPNGSTVITGVQSLVGYNFLKGEGGQFVSDSLVGQLVEMIMYAQLKEVVQYSATGSNNNIVANYNTDTQKLTGSFTCDVQTTVVDTDGSWNILAKEFLT